MRFCLLASGSKGNCVWIGAAGGGGSVLIDNGLSCSEFLKRATLAGLPLGGLRDIVVSHEHSDHIGGVGPLARKLGLTVHMTKIAAVSHATRLGPVRLRTFEPGDTLGMGDISLSTMTGSHDAADPVAFVARRGGKSLGLATDLGVVTQLIRRNLEGLDALILEFNHDLGMLLGGPYPFFLKQRVRGRLGHLSNDEAAEALRSLNHPGLRELVLAHLSETNNDPGLARRAAESALAGHGHRPNLTVASQARPTAILGI
ncbi:MAG: MBL fold metallo-hydrolase [Deltaproteobacteria bacterium]|jgi:phosphoribosyl 1,2-cyclic phosphodiesterase|nr:MBL fold metallo-hydrolase [Deltaproteobacteria bacterium]